jgi:hypothetical protein
MFVAPHSQATSPRSSRRGAAHPGLRIRQARALGEAGELADLVVALAEERA